MANWVQICLVFSLALTCVCAQVGSLCRPNERLLECGCPKTCEDPAPNCKGVCKTGCFCEEGEVRNSKGLCVKLADCPPVSKHLLDKLDTSEPRLHVTCPDNEEYRFCEPCLRTCETPNPICPAQCSRGCFCKGNLLRDKDGRCVPFHECSHFFNYKNKHLLDKLDRSKPRFEVTCPDNEEFKLCKPCLRTCEKPNPELCPRMCTSGCSCKGDLLRDKDGRCVQFQECSNFLDYIKEREKNHVDPVPSRFTCGTNKIYKECEKCTQSCENPKPVCGTKCKTGCLCKDGFVTGPDGKCMTIEECPKARAATLFSFPSASSVEVEDCNSGEEYFSCGWCEPTCQEPNPNCPSGCTRGCLCSPPLLRHSSGECVMAIQCKSNRCSVNEEYRCQFGCEATCGGTRCQSRSRPRCTLGCRCKPTFVRNKHGQCVKVDMCEDDDIGEVTTEDALGTKGIPP